MEEHTPIKVALTIAGSDSSGGAGIQADLKTFHALGVFGTSAVTAVTVQNTKKVHAIQEMRPQIVHDQIMCLFEDFTIHAVKIGMVSSTPIVHAISEALQKVQCPSVVLDPVMISKSGVPLLQEEARDTLVAKLFPLADVVTPNIHEAETLIHQPITSMDHMKSAAKKIRQLGPAKVVIKGGHMDSEQATDITFDGRTFQILSSARTDTVNTHGTGCTFSSAIAAYLAKGFDFFEAVRQAKNYISGAIAHALNLGNGQGPTHHFFDLYRRAGID